MVLWTTNSIRLLLPVKVDDFPLILNYMHGMTWLLCLLPGGLIHRAYDTPINILYIPELATGYQSSKDCSQTYKISRFSRDVTAAMLMYRTIAKKVFWEFDSIIMQNLSDILPSFCTPTWPSHHVSENQE